VTSGAATRFTLSLPNRGVLLGILTADELLDAATRAEASGHFAGVGIGDNLLEKPRLEAIALLGALTARTRRVGSTPGASPPSSCATPSCSPSSGRASMS